MVQILPEGEGNIFGRIGSSLGKSLAEQVPKEVERYRLSKGLERLTKQANEGNLSPLETISKLYGIPGLSPEAAGSVLPYLKAQEGRSQRIQQEPERMSLEQSKAPTQAISQNIKPERQQSYSERLNSGTFLQGFSPEEKQQKISDFLKSRPFATEEEAISKIDKQEADRMSFDQSLNVKKERIEKEVSNLINEFIQKKGNDVYKDITGRLQEGTYIPKAISDVLDKGMGEKEAALKIANDALAFAKSKRTLKDLGYGVTKGSEEIYNSLNSSRKEYEKRGLLEDFKDDLQTYQGASPEVANFLAFPVSSNKELQNSLDKLPNLGSLKFEDIKKHEKAVQDAIKNLNEKDSLQSIALYLQTKGYNPQWIMRGLAKASQEEKIELSPMQEKEIQGAPNFYRTLGDLFLSGVSKKFASLGRFENE